MPAPLTAGALYDFREVFFTAKNNF